MVSKSTEQCLHDELIEFMFQKDAAGKIDAMKCLTLWFGKSNDTDIEILTRFGTHVENALRGDYDSWKSTARGCLALMILIDQFPRNIFRHTVRSFQGDPAARNIAYTGHDWLAELEPEHCIFVPCLIFTHQENIDDQNEGLKFYEVLEPHLPTELHIFRTILSEHQRIIKICGVFPHRDHYYGRATTDNGRMLMENPKLRFDLPLISKNGVVSFGHDASKLWTATQHVFDILERIDMFSNTDTATCGAANFVSSKDRAEAMEVFRAFDKDGSGSFDRAELSAILVSTGRDYPPQKVQDIIDKITGVKNSESISFEQFIALLQVHVPSDWEGRLRQRFDMFDADKSGEITFDEMRTCIQHLDELVTMAEVEEMFKLCDVDNNGLVSFEEFLAVVPVVMSRRTSAVVIGIDDGPPQLNLAGGVWEKLGSEQVTAIQVTELVAV